MGETDRLRLIEERNAELEGAVAIRTAELAASNKELEAFCYAVSHDLRAPLRSIDGFAYALLQDFGENMDSEALDFVNRIRAASKRMDELISALLSLSRLTTSEMVQEQVELSKLALASVHELSQSYPELNASVTIEPDLTVIGDKRMLRAVLDNLLGNAFKFSAKVENPKIEFGREGKMGPYFVKDNGVGFDMIQSDKLFKPFERLHSPRDFTGSGIGLATVYRILQKHGGKIWAKSEPDKGATFYFQV